MAKPKSPLLSLGARGTIADSLTFQKRGQLTIARKKPIPEDPKSPAQLSQRQKYKDAVAAWHALSPEEKAAWRGVCPGLTAYQCFMSSELKYAPPPIPIDIGSPAIDRPSQLTYNRTYINKDNPADGNGKITSIEIWAYANIEGCIVGTFYTTNGDTLKCRDSEAIPGTIAAHSKVTKAVSISVETGDYIGLYFTLGNIERHISGYAGVWYIIGEYIDPNDEATYILMAGDTMSLYGTGKATP